MPAAAASTLEDFLAGELPQSFHPQADRFGNPAGKLKRAPLYRGEKLLGYVFLNSDVVGSIGYSGKPIQILIGLDKKGIITGAKLVKHTEPIVLVGIPEKKITDFIDGYIGKNVYALAKAIAGSNRSIDIVSGATVTIMVIDDSIVRSAVKMARAISGRPDPGISSTPPRNIDMKKSSRTDWQTLLGDGSVRRLVLSVGDVNAAFAKAGQTKALIAANEAKPGAVFIEMYAALVSIPTIGRSLLGEAEYNILRRALKPGQHAVLIAGNGLYSFKGSGYVRGGIFDRIQLIQGEGSVRFRDKHHKRLGAVEAAGAIKYREVALFRLPVKSGFRADLPWRIQLLVSRPVGPLDKVFQTFDLRYTPLMKYFKPAAGTLKVKQPAGPSAEPPPLWQRLWKRKIVDVAILIVAIGVLTVIFFFQNWYVKNRKRAD
ncbi:MAG: FMN-binding protein, partial [Alphaproteobacteria bacterium]